MKFLGFINRLYDKKISAKGLAVFRICFAIVLFFDVNRIFRYRQLYFDPIPYLETSSINYTIPLIIWMIVLLMLAFGVLTRVMAVINYLFVIWFLNIVGPFEYHMDYTYIGVSFLMVFIPLSKSYSIDNLLEKLRYSNTKQLYKPNEKTTVLGYLLIVFVGIALIYFGSVFFKFNSIAWKNGLGLWLPSSIPPLTITNSQWLLNQEWFMRFLGYFTFAFEIIFPFTFFIKRLRPYLFIIGIGLHLGILFKFPIPCFALGYMAIYLLMVPVGFWNKLSIKLQFKTPKLQFFYDAECPLCIRTKIIIAHFDILNAIVFKSVQEHASNTEALKNIPKTELLNNIYSVSKKGKVYSGVNTYKKISTLIPMFYPLAVLFYIPGVSLIANKIYSYIAENRGLELCTETNCTVPTTTKINSRFFSNNRKFHIIGLKVLIVLLVLFQLNSIPSNRVLRKIANKGIISSVNAAQVSNIKNGFSSFSSKLLGIMSHGVFVDGHYIGFDKVFTIKYNEKLLPLFDENGMPDTYLKAGVWADFGFRVNRPYVLEIEKDVLKKGFRRYTSFWAHKNNIDLNNAEFTIVMKRIRGSFNWEKDLLKINMAAPWQNVGTIVWKNKTAKVNLEKIE